MEDNSAERVTQLTYLGVIVDEKKQFEENIDGIINRVKRRLVTFAKIRRYMNTNTAFINLVW